MKHERTLFGNCSVLLFLVAQGIDGVFTYVGVQTLGIGMEGNPLVAWFMTTSGYGFGIVCLKGMASMLGIVLHQVQIHGWVAFLATLYIVVAILPWFWVLSG